MGSHPLNLAIRFLLEVTALVGVGIWGYNQSESWLKFGLALVLPLIMATCWVTFAVPDDPSRSGNAPVVTPGIIRLLLELIMLGFGAWAIYDLGYSRVGLFIAIVLVLHYVVSYDRIAWLLKQ